MARKRMIDPKFWTDEKIAKLSREARLLFIGIWNFSDDSGIHKNSNLSLKMEIFPGDVDISDKDIERLKNELINCDLIVPYTYENHELFLIQNWNIYQKINRPIPSKYELPNNVLTEDSLNTHGVLTPNRIERNRIEQNRGKGYRSENSHTPPNLSFLDKLKENYTTLDVEKSYRKFKQYRKDKGLGLDEEAFVIWLDNDLEKGWNVKPKVKNGKIKVRCIKGCTQKEVTRGKIRDDFCPECGEQLLEEWEIEQEKAAMKQKDLNKVQQAESLAE